MSIRDWEILPYPTEKDPNRYRVSTEEKEQLEWMLKGDLPFPDSPEPFLKVKAINQALTKDDRQEVALLLELISHGD